MKQAAKSPRSKKPDAAVRAGSGRPPPACTAWEKIFRDLRERIGRQAPPTTLAKISGFSPEKAFPADKSSGLPSVSQVAADHPGEPFRVLVATMISLRTKDEVTCAAAERLFAKAANPAQMAALPEKEIEKLIYPAGFYRTKAANIRKAARRIANDYAGEVPPDRQLLMAFSGVGRKTANLVLNLGFGIDAICVDTHVHRISNRTGWVETKTPEETEMALCEIMPKKFWIPLNELLVKYGQTVCTPASPHCGSCPLAADRCEKRGVTRTRD
jgi:endonuclease-3